MCAGDDDKKNRPASRSVRRSRSQRRWTPHSSIGKVAHAAPRSSARHVNVLSSLELGPIEGSESRGEALRVFAVSPDARAADSSHARDMHLPQDAHAAEAEGAVDALGYRADGGCGHKPVPSEEATHRPRCFSSRRSTASDRERVRGNSVKPGESWGPGGGITGELSTGVRPEPAQAPPTREVDVLPDRQ